MLISKPFYAVIPNVAPGLWYIEGPGIPLHLRPIFRSAEKAEEVAGLLSLIYVAGRDEGRKLVQDSMQRLLGLK